MFTLPACCQSCNFRERRNVWNVTLLSAQPMRGTTPLKAPKMNDTVPNTNIQRGCMHNCCVFKTCICCCKCGWPCSPVYDNVCIGFCPPSTTRHTVLIIKPGPGASVSGWPGGLRVLLIRSDRSFVWQTRMSPANRPVSCTEVCSRAPKDLLPVPGGAQLLQEAIRLHRACSMRINIIV